MNRPMDFSHFQCVMMTVGMWNLEFLDLNTVARSNYQSIPSRAKSFAPKKSVTLG